MAKRCLVPICRLDESHGEVIGVRRGSDWFSGSNPFGELKATPLGAPHCGFKSLPLGCRHARREPQRADACTAGSQPAREAAELLARHVVGVIEKSGDHREPTLHVVEAAPQQVDLRLGVRRELFSDVLRFVTACCEAGKE